LQRLSNVEEILRTCSATFDYLSIWCAVSQTQRVSEGIFLWKSREPKASGPGTTPV